jgi:phospho-N-acetylmuramoyl-pentapeptide-transferase
VLYNETMISDLAKLYIPATIAFVVGILLTPIVTHYLYKNQMWKKKAGKIAPDGRATPIFDKLHETREVGTPKMGGIIIWASVLITIVGFWVSSKLVPFSLAKKFDFLSRSQTLIPVVTLLFGALVGLLDDYLDVKGSKDHIAGGLSFKKRILVVALIGFCAAMWFYVKLGVSSIGLPFGHSLYLGIFFVPFFILVTAAVYSGGVIDGLDGLAGGIFAAMFSAYGGIAFAQHQIDLAAFCAVTVGAILAFLWFNVPPARFYMSETGSMSLTITLTIVAFMTDSLAGGYGILVLPVIAFPLLLTSSSVILQLISKKTRNGKKIFQIAPLHHHFEAQGWPASKVTMRYWIISIVLAALGMLLALVGQHT